ncbi:MAG TPA: ExeM/NucH family extracellular endonuclease, partial [Pyrinomonadaceae bacterium]|nr:ExeM/NucH family extracellular endonuclease [Pyrinomonadaceae bacterium]
AFLDGLDHRRVILDDDNNTQESYLGSPDGSQSVFYPRANGGFSVGTQGVDFFRGGDQVDQLTGVLDFASPGSGAATWRIRPSLATPATFTVANPRPATPPAVGGSIKAASMNLQNYFTTIDTTSNSSGPCAPSGTQDCRGADSVAELTRQRDRLARVVCAVNADVFAFMELENTASVTINDLLGAINSSCGGTHPYTFVNTGGTLGTDAVRVQQIYRTGILSPVGSPLVDLDPVHNNPPTAQTFDVVDAANVAFGQRFTVVANHLKSRDCTGATGADVDAGDGQGCFNSTRTGQVTRLINWISGTVVPAAGDPDVLLLGDFNSYAKEVPVTNLGAAGYTDKAPTAYSYVSGGQIGHLDYGFANSTLSPQVTGAAVWHINADESDLFDYNDEIKDVGEAAFEEKPDGSALAPPRVVFQPASPYRAADHDPVVVGIFFSAPTAAHVSVSGRVLTTGGYAIKGARVILTGPDDVPMVALTNSFGYYNFDAIESGHGYSARVVSKGWTFQSRIISVIDTLADEDFVANP